MVTVVVVGLDESLSVELTAGTTKPCAYTVVYEDEEIAQYETSADPRTIGGRVSLRNVICRRVPDREKSEVDTTLSVEIETYAAELAEEFGPR